MSEVKRKLATILAADCVGFSKHMETQEEKTLLSLKECRDIIDPVINKFSGRIFHTAGDSIIAEFDSPVGATNASIEFQKAIKERNSLEQTNPKLFWRVGVHLDDIIIEGDNNKVLIIAAGLGSRLKKHTENLPKCMLDFGGKTLLQRQLDAYKKCGIKDISLIRGYKKEKINFKGIKYFENTDYKNNNILNSIFYAEKIINGNIIISYSDILFDSSVVERTLDSDHDISVVVDIDWRGYMLDVKIIQYQKRKT